MCSLLLSSFAFAETANTSTVEIVSFVDIITNGIIITPDENGTDNAYITLPHGTKTEPVDSTTDIVSAYIKSTHGPLPSGITVRLDLTSDILNDNNMSIGESVAENIPHLLSGKVKNGNTAKEIISLSQSTFRDSTEVVTTENVLIVDFTSSITKNNLVGKRVGTYKNTSNLSVTVLAK